LIDRSIRIARTTIAMARDARRTSSRLSGQGARAPDAATGTKTTRASTRVQSTTATDASRDDAGRDEHGGAAGEDGTVVNVPRRARTGACARARARDASTTTRRENRRERRLTTTIFTYDE
jgi:hypothetical protein